MDLKFDIIISPGLSEARDVNSIILFISLPAFTIFFTISAPQFVQNFALSGNSAPHSLHNCILSLLLVLLCHLLTDCGIGIGLPEISGIISKTVIDPPSCSSKVCFSPAKKKRPSSLNSISGAKTLKDTLFAKLPPEDNTVSSFVVGMVDQIGSFSADIIKSPLPFEQAADKTVLSDNQPLYHGMTGLQTAVICFLGNVIERKENWRGIADSAITANRRLLKLSNRRLLRQHRKIDFMA